MPDATLGPSAFIVLGFLNHAGPATAYDLKRWVDDSVGFFWSFPRSQLYAEPQRLVTLGLLAETQEESGRRRRLYSVTDAGRAALADWRRSPAGMPELRDPGLLRMFFTPEEDHAALRALAAGQLRQHQERLATYRDMLGGEPCPWPERPPFTRTLRMGELYEQACLTFWQEVLDGLRPE
ncbi:PadR family transcriptional regulator [Deinococcus sedimenti]|uniref:PadR family transcriptional regulator n=1 Tax=Deinococcus sedimenti TaxID=1867090 RepID=A0ABQ2S2F8_9DEIO|nr:PadR family transcriptional regulator [Deinococcus sedimenti]GGR87850.1 PadR family transcriptional regulator [Deinococcus sedimenti]